MRCCGSERDTPFCPSCGKKLGSPNPLVGLLHYLRKMEASQRGAYEKQFKYRVGHLPTHTGLDPQRVGVIEKHPDVRKPRENMEKWKRWADALDATLNQHHGKVIADYLEENGHQEAAKIVRGAFE